MSEIKAIPTRYKGYHFRSRLEARWAVLLDALEVEWLYEHEGFKLGDAMYLPDFWLPQFELHLEVKGLWPTDSEREVADRLQKMSGKKLLIVIGLPGSGDGGYIPYGFEASTGHIPIAVNPRLSHALTNQCGATWDWGEGMKCPACGEGYVHFTNQPPSLASWQGDGDAWRLHLRGECEHSWTLRFGFHKGGIYVAVENCTEVLHGPIILANGSRERFAAAIAAAKSSRFEHGEFGPT